MSEGLFDRERRVHLVGIRGSGMSGIATALASYGHRVTGSDLAPRPDLCRLAAAGISVVEGHAAENLPEDADLVVVSAAIGSGNEELSEALARGLKVAKYAEALGALMGGKRGIAVAGAHGKTTTTGLLAFVLDRLGADPTFLAGGDVAAFGGSSRVGGSDLIVAEACEYDRSFHHLRPEMAVVTNIDEDHLDYYSGIAEITEAFVTFAGLLPAHGALITLNEHARTFCDDPRVVAPVITVGIEKDADWTAREVAPAAGGMRFVIHGGGLPPCPVRIRLPGHHHVLAALMVAAVGVRLGHALPDIAAALWGFCGVGRRFDVKYQRDGLVVLDDYAHHPAEIRACLGSIRHTWPGSRVWCVFQPHQASRTRFLLREFACALAEADRVVVPRIFFARDSEEERRLICSEDLAMKVTNLGTRAEHIADFKEIEKHLLGRLRPRDVLVTMGAGDIFRVADAVVATLEGFRDVSIPA